MGKKKERFHSSAKEIKNIYRSRKSSRKHKIDASATIEGVFSYSGRGFGFCVPDESFKTGDIFIPPRCTMGAMSGDRVKVSVGAKYGGSGERLEGEVISVTPSCASLIGTLHVEKGYAYFIPDSKKTAVCVYVPIKDVENSGAGDNFKVEVVPDGEPFFTRSRSVTVNVRGVESMPYFDTVGRISSVFGNSLTRDANYSAVLYSYGIRTEFPDAVLSDAARAAHDVPSGASASESRRDLRGRHIFTIDGAGAKDLDDAISLDVTEDGWILGVHIADVSHYVKQNSPTEYEARARGTSVYFTDKVVPMLPEALSNGACSLNADTDKYALTAEITLDRGGRRKRTVIYKSVIRSVIRGVYEEINDIFEKGADSEFSEKYEEIASDLREMRKLFAVLKKNQDSRGVMTLEDNEAVIILDADGVPTDVVRRVRGEAEMLIEQFMLQANMGVAETLHALSLPCLYRIHEKPDPEKMRSFAVFVNNIGIRAGDLTNDEITPEELSSKLSAILRAAEEKGIASVVSSVLLRCLMKAKYQSVPALHFGLGVYDYCHFTSPIRRYPDLFVHTVISTVLEKAGISSLNANSKVSDDIVPELSRIAAERGASSSECEIRAQNAERDIEDLYMAIYMKDHVGEKFNVMVTSVVKSGLFVQCENLIEGFLPASCFENVKINDELMTLTSGERVITLGTPLSVTLTDVDISQSQITFGV